MWYSELDRLACSITGASASCSASVSLSWEESILDSDVTLQAAAQVTDNIHSVHDHKS